VIESWAPIQAILAAPWIAAAVHRQISGYDTDKWTLRRLPTGNTASAVCTAWTAVVSLWYRNRTANSLSPSRLHLRLAEWRRADHTANPMRPSSRIAERD